MRKVANFYVLVLLELEELYFFEFSFASGKSEIFLGQSAQKREVAGLIKDETFRCPFPSLPGPALTWWT